jgi:hypothetical protein
MFNIFQSQQSSRGSTASRWLIPRATLEIPTSQRRLERILKLIQQCAYSIHDLSRVQLDAKAPRTPRFKAAAKFALAAFAAVLA